MRTIGRQAPGALLLAVLLAGPAWTQTVDDVISRYLRARGGAERLRAVSSLRLTGTLELPGVPPAPFVMELKRPARMRTEFTVEGRTGVRAYDGTRGWVLLPLPGEQPQAMSAEDAADARAQADVDLSPLVDSAAKGYRVELEGRDRVPGAETFRLLVRGPEGPPRTVHVDTKSGLVVTTEDVRTVEGRPMEFVTHLGDYRSVDGLTFPFRIETGPGGSAESQRLVIRRIEVNPVIDDRRFAMPTARQGP